MRCETTLLIAAMLAGCTTVGPDYRAPSASDLSVPQDWQGGASSGAPTATQDLSHWWKQFNDPLLDRLIEEASAANLDIAIAAARLAQAREALIQARVGNLPTVGGSGGVGGSADVDGTTRANLSIGANASWEIDLFGRIRRGVEAAQADTESAYFDREAIRIATVAEIASNYMQARLAQERLTLAREALDIAEENLQIAEWRRRDGLVSSLDVEQARTQRAQSAAAIPSIENEYNAAAYRLAVLTGRAPGAMTPFLAERRPIPSGPDNVAAGIPADTLRQRPDVRSAERAVGAAVARIGVAEAQLYPALRLSGSIGTTALSLGGLLDAITGTIFAGLDQTFFDGGRLRSQVRAQEAATEGALADYRRSVLTALEDVENALSALATARAREVEFAEALEAAQNSAILARSQYRAGLTDFQTLLEAERSLVAAREGVATSRGAEALALVQLYRALGGGWDPSAAPQTGVNS